MTEISLYLALGLAASLTGCLVLALRSHSSRQNGRRAEDKTKAILDAAVDGVVTIDEHGIVETFNKAAERIFGYTASEVIGRNVKMLMPEPRHSEHDGYLAAYKATGRAKIIGIGREVIGQRKDGSTFPMDLAVGESRSSGGRRFAGICRDITARKRTEEQLRQSEERFRLIVDNVRDYGITWLDPEGRIVSWNEGAGRLYGWTADEVIGRSSEIFYPPEFAEEAHKALQTVREAGRYESEGWRVRKGGSRFWAHAVITPLWDGAGGMRGFVRVSRDITDRRQAELALRTAKEEAELANQAKSNFLAAASHDLRQPVQALFFFTTALESKVNGGPAGSLLGELKGSLNAMHGLLNALLDVSRLDAGAIAPELTNVSLASILDRQVADIEPTATQRGNVLRVVRSSALIHTDPVLLGRVLQNLLSNAVKYTSEGRILVGARRCGQRLRIEVWDSGIGIAEEQLQKIFQEFYQVGNIERDRTQGLGLGLAIVQRLARLLDSTVTVRSREGRGSVFAIDVPVVGFNRSRNITHLGAPPAEKRRHEKPLVLVIDDEVAVLRGLELVIGDWGYDVLTATGEDEALDALSNHPDPPDLIVADYRLRDGRTGAQAIHNIRQAFGRAIPSVIITGDTAPERIREARAHGLDILHKPVHPAALKTMISDAVD